MTAVPHSSFLASFPKDLEFDHPAGASFARELESKLRSRSFSVEEFDNWRDCGWVVHVQVREKLFEVYFAEYGEESQQGWLLAVAPLNQPGALARLFGHKAIPVEAELQSLAVAVHEILSAHPAVTNIRWFLGGPPEKVPSYASPHELALSDQS
ncbi:hypothetical protein [Peristeroidobacter agariperforans]|uniref:hypothetical protein n=1 Tax=Peristeroidobacter agariperforans TaxID=268404 RepID=UPI00101BD3CA|nr:hypothetical protein [Peristeroidobacter agariperforans]